MPKQVLSCTVNDEPVEVLVQPWDTLLDALRERMGLTGPKEGCGTGDCGACTVHLDGKPIASCLVLAMQARGRVGPHDRGPRPAGRAASAAGRVRPPRRAAVRLLHSGVLMAAAALLTENPHPTEEEIRYGIAGNLCRCTGYTKMLAAITETAGAASGRRS